MSYQKSVFVLNETARFRFDETPALHARFALFRTSVLSNPANSAREAVDGAIRYRLVRGWIWAYVLTGDETSLVVSVLSVDQPQDIPASSRIWAVLRSIMANYIPHMKEAEQAYGAFRKPR